MTESFTTGVVLALIAQAGLLAAGYQQRRKSKQERENLAVDVMADVNSELRTELTRMHADIERLRAENQKLDGELRIARAEIRGAHETAGRAMRRVETLEALLRQHAIPFDPGS